MQLPIQEVVNVSVSEAPLGLSAFNVNNLAMFTDESPTLAFANGYGVYKTATAVGNDFGSSSKTFAMATAIFAQTPNLLAGNGELIIFPLLTDLDAVTEVQKISFSAAPASGTFVLNYGALPTAAIPYTDDAAAVQVALRLVAGLGGVTVTGSFAAGYVITFTGVSGAFPALVVSNSSLKDSSGAGVSTSVSITVYGVAAGSTETLISAILRTQGSVSYCGIIKENTYVSNELIVAATYVQTQDMMLFVASHDVADIAVTTGIFWQIEQAALSQTRCFLYVGDATYDTANKVLAGYVGRAMSVDFSGSNTVITMQLKTINGAVADANMTQTIFTACGIAGVDIYPSFNGVPKVWSNGENKFYDQVYNLLWFVTSLQVAGFNALATTATKLPQTEQGAGVLTTAFSAVCAQAVTNGYFAPGTWTGDIFGNQADMLRNIADVGFYIYHQPVAQQSQADRAARKAPLFQIAGKEAGADHTANVLVNINA